MTTTAERPPVDQPPAQPRRRGRGRIGRRLVYAGLAMFLLSLVAQITGVDDLTASGTFGAALRLGVPIMLAGLGGLYSERAGIVNIGLEGMMILGTWFGAWGAFQFGPWWGIVIGLVGGAIGGLLHAIATVTFAVDHIVSGVAINILALGAMRFASVVFYEGVPGGGSTQSPRVEGAGQVDIPFLGGGTLFGWDTPNLTRWLESIDIFFISDVGGLLAAVSTDLDWLTAIALALIPLSWWVLWRTAWGLRLRSCGENPWAAESLGVPVLRFKYWGVVISGALAGLGGVFLVLAQAGIYREGQTGGRGFIGLAALIFGNYRPWGILAGSGLFGFADALRLRSGAVQPLLLVVAIGLAALAVWSIRSGRIRSAGIQAAVAVGFLLWYLGTDQIPDQFIPIIPHVTTLLVLAIASQRLRMPAADGARYRKGESH